MYNNWSRRNAENISMRIRGDSWVFVLNINDRE